MIPQEALQLLHNLVESIKLTGSERDKTREAAKNLQDFILTITAQKETEKGKIKEFPKKAD